MFDPYIEILIEINPIKLNKTGGKTGRNETNNTPPLSCRRQITLSQIEEVCPITKSKPDLHNINAHIKFGENPLWFTQVISLIRKYQCVAGEICRLAIPKQNSIISIHESPLIFTQVIVPKQTLAKIYRSAIPNQIVIILMLIPGFVKIHWYLLK